MRKPVRFLAFFLSLALLFSCFVMIKASDNDARFAKYVNMGQNAIDNNYAIPNLFRQNGVFSNQSRFPLVVKNGAEYVPISMFILYSDIEVTYSKKNDNFYLLNKKTGEYLSFNVEENVASSGDGELFQMRTYIFNRTRYIPARNVAEFFGFVCESYDDAEKGVYCFRVSDGRSKQTLKEMAAPYIEAYFPKKEPEKTTENKPVEQSPENNKTEPVSPEQENPQTPNVLKPPEPSVVYPSKEETPKPPKENTTEQPEENTPIAPEVKPVENPKENEPEKPKDPIEEVAKRYVCLCFSNVKSESTESLLGTLKRYGIKASFAVTREDILTNTDMVRNVFAMGNSLVLTAGAEGETPEQYADSFVQNLENANKALKLVMKQKTRLCVSDESIPETVLDNEEFKNIVKEAGYVLVEANTITKDGSDYKGSAYAVSAAIKNKITGGFSKEKTAVLTCRLYISEKSGYYSIDVASLVNKYEQFGFYSMDEALLMMAKEN